MSTRKKNPQQPGMENFMVKNKHHQTTSDMS
jgi:hypothetical protein